MAQNITPLQEIMNFTLKSSAESFPELRTYRYIKLASAIVLCILSPITAIPNALLLTAIYRGPLRCFRTPMTYLIAGLAVADLLTGIFVEPMVASCYFADFRNKASLSYRLMYRIGGIISGVTITESYFIVLALSICQYIAVRYPHQFKAIVSRNRVFTSLAVSSVYITCFSMLQFTGIDYKTYLKIHLILHATFISATLVVVQVMLFLAFNRHLKHSRLLQNSSAHIAASLKNRHSERQFTVMIFYLAAILLASCFLHVVAFYIFLFKKPTNREENINIHSLLLISDLMLYIKVALDVFIYAWRNPSYRRALWWTLLGRRTYRRVSVCRKSTDGISPGHLHALEGPGTQTATAGKDLT
ncbi:adrenocorticotropic hormone receptor-like [Montipora foliosa]|uniref:adrenocorticotropic hormone receptor-like n=1 Tax=Montipora foliosa TaxID=591990 RepID=UPI0035F19F7C